MQRIRGKIVEKVIWVNREKKVNKNSIKIKTRTPKNKNQNPSLHSSFLLHLTPNKNLKRPKNSNFPNLKNNIFRHNSNNKILTLISQLYPLLPRIRIHIHIQNKNNKNLQLHFLINFMNSLPNNFNKIHQKTTIKTLKKIIKMKIIIIITITMTCNKLITHFKIEYK